MFCDAVDKGWCSYHLPEDLYIDVAIYFAVSAVALFLLYAVYYLFWMVSVPSIRVSKTSPLNEIIKTLHILQEPYWPTFWISHGHLQTIRGAFDHWDQPEVTYKRELMDVHAVDDKHYDGHVALDWVVTGYQTTPTTPTCFILHGLTGGSSARYVKVAAHKLSISNHWRSVVINARGCGGSTLKTPQAFCAAYTEDVRQVIANIAERFPHSPLFAVGYSLGSNILVKYLGEEGKNTPLRGAVSIANPFNLISSNHKLHQSWIGRHLYSRRLTANLVKLCSRWTIFQKRKDLDLSEMSNAKDILEFDEKFTSKAFGYSSGDAYYHDASCNRYIENVQIPLLCINAIDDPICWHRAIPYTACVSNENLIFVTTRAGGHSMDWFTGSFTSTPKSWSAEVFSTFFQSLYFWKIGNRNQSQSSDVKDASDATTSSDMETSIQQWDEVLGCLEQEHEHTKEALDMLTQVPEEMAKFRENIKLLTERIIGLEDKKSDALKACEEEISVMKYELSRVRL